MSSRIIKIDAVNKRFEYDTCPHFKYPHHLIDFLDVGIVEPSNKKLSMMIEKVIKLPHENAIYADEDGLLKVQKYGFHIVGSEHIIVGNGFIQGALIYGEDDEGNPNAYHGDCDFTIEQIQRIVVFDQDFVQKKPKTYLKVWGVVERG